MSTRAVEDVRASLNASAAGLASIAQRLAEASSEPTPDARALRQIALTVQALGHRAGLVAAGATFAAGQLAAFAHVATEAFDHAARVVEAEAERDAFLYYQDRKENPDTCPSAEQWAREAFQGNWDDEWHDGLGIERGAAEALYAAAWTRAVAKLEG